MIGDEQVRRREMAVEHLAHPCGIAAWQLQLDRVHAALDRLGHSHRPALGRELLARAVEIGRKRAGLCYQPGDEHRANS
ncbi:MAG: hypothetical protein ACTHK5_06370 [Tsuneonella sp.]